MEKISTNEQKWLCHRLFKQPLKPSVHFCIFICPQTVASFPEGATASTVCSPSIMISLMVSSLNASLKIPTSSSMPLKYRGPKAHLPIARSAFTVSILYFLKPSKTRLCTLTPSLYKLYSLVTESYVPATWCQSVSLQVSLSEKCQRSST